MPSICLAGSAILTGGSQFKILVEGLCRAVGRNHLVALGGGLGHQIDPLPVVRQGFGGISLDRIVESSNRLVRLAGVSEYCPFVEVEGSRIGGLGRGGRGVLLHCLLGLT